MAARVKMVVALVMVDEAEMKSPRAELNSVDSKFSFPIFLVLNAVWDMKMKKDGRICHVKKKEI